MYMFIKILTNVYYFSEDRAFQLYDQLTDIEKQACANSTRKAIQIADHVANNYRIHDY